MIRSKSLVLVVEDDPAMLRFIRRTLEFNELSVELDRQTGEKETVDWCGANRRPGLVTPLGTKSLCLASGFLL